MNQSRAEIIRECSYYYCMLVLDCLWTMKQNTDFEVDLMDGWIELIAGLTVSVDLLLEIKMILVSYSTCTVRVPALVAGQCSEAVSDFNAWGF
jgi:hypothetical protein